MLIIVVDVDTLTRFPVRFTQTMGNYLCTQPLFLRFLPVEFRAFVAWTLVTVFRAFRKMVQSPIA